MSIFRTNLQKLLPFEEGEYQATMLRMDWKDTKSGDPMMIIDFKLQNGSKGRAMFPQVNDFFVAEAKQACEVLLGVAEPEDFKTFFKLADQKAGRTKFKLLLTYHHKQNGQRTRNFLVRSLRDEDCTTMDNFEFGPFEHHYQRAELKRRFRAQTEIADKRFEPAWAGQEEV